MTVGGVTAGRMRSSVSIGPRSVLRELCSTVTHSLHLGEPLDDILDTDRRCDLETSVHPDVSDIRG